MESLTLTGHKVRFVNRPRSRFDKTKFVNLVFVELEPAVNNKDIHEIKTLCRHGFKLNSPSKRMMSSNATGVKHLDTLKIIAKTYPTASDVAYNTVWRPA